MLASPVSAKNTADTCELNGWAVADYYVDNDKSASNGKARPESERLISDAKADRIDVIVVWNHPGRRRSQTWNAPLRATAARCAHSGLRSERIGQKQLQGLE